jgi:hypothetical protein
MGTALGNLLSMPEARNDSSLNGAVRKGASGQYTHLTIATTSAPPLLVIIESAIM